MTIRTMMRSFASVLLAAVLCMALTPMSADAVGTPIGMTFGYDGVTYQVLSDSTVRVGDGSSPAIPTGTYGAKSIPATATGDGMDYSVVAVAASAFSGASSLTTVTLPDSIETIGDSAFAGCTTLRAVDLGSGVRVVGASAFQSSGNLRWVEGGVSVTSIGSGAFRNCSLLSSGVPGPAVTEIGGGAFSGCQSLTIYSLPPGLHSVGPSAFYDVAFDLRSAVVSGLAASYVYAGEEVCPEPNVTVFGEPLTQGSNYDVSYEHNDYPGRATLKLTGTPYASGQWGQRYSGECTTTFQIAPGLDASSMDILVGETGALRFCGGSGTAYWSSSNRSVATVSSRGVVTGLRGGTAYITATRGGLKRKCLVTVGKRSYRLSISRTVSSGKGYIDAVAKSWRGVALPNRTVAFYKNGSYLGSAKTNTYGKARLAVAKNRSDVTYKAALSGDAVHLTTSVSKPLVFVTSVYSQSAVDILSGTAYLGLGTYRIYVYGDGALEGDVGGVSIEGGSGSWAQFTVVRAGYFTVSGISWEDEGEIRIQIVKYL